MAHPGYTLAAEVIYALQTLPPGDDTPSPPSEVLTATTLIQLQRAARSSNVDENSQLSTIPPLFSA